MENVKDAIGHYHFFTAFTRCRYGQLQFLFGHHAKAGICASTYSVFQLDRRNRGRPQFADHHTSRRIGKEAGFFQRITRCQCCRQHTNHRVARTGNVIHFLRLSWHMQRCFTRLQQRHPLFGTGHQQSREFVIGNQFHAALNNLFFSLTFTDNSFKFREIRR